MDADGNLYVANCGNNTIRKVTPDGTSSIFVSSSLLSCPNGLTIDDEGNLYTANFNNGRVIKITPDGTVSVLVTLTGSNNGHLTYRNERLYVVSRGGHRVYEVDLNGSWKVLAGSGARGKADGPAIQATFSLPNGIGVSPDGNTIYINDAIPLTGTNVLNPVVVRKIDGILDNTTSVDGEQEIPNKFFLEQNYPNPFNPSTKISFTIPNVGDAIHRGGASQTNVILKVYDILGTEVATLVNESKNAGKYEIDFNAEGLSSGMYFYTLTAGSLRETKKMILLR